MIEIIGNENDNLLIGSENNEFLLGKQGKDTLIGGEGDDTLIGGSNNDKLLGQYGNDTLTGQYGNDTLRGGSGFDFISGGFGNDVLDGGRGRDTLIGGNGKDWYALNHPGNIDTLDLIDTDKATDKIALNLKPLTGSIFAEIYNFSEEDIVLLRNYDSGEIELEILDDGLNNTLLYISHSVTSISILKFYDLDPLTLENNISEINI